MFIDTTDTLIKAVMNIEHCSQNFRNYSKKISVLIHPVLRAHGPVPNATWNQYFTHTSLCSSTFTLSSNTCSLLHHCITCSVACEHKNPLLSACHEVAPSPSAGRSLYRREKTPSLSAECLLYCCEETPLPSTVHLLCIHEDTARASLNAGLM